tara:strand:- start:256 stop:813 length:558 start_codon:yes stop_codon:yes gene_type:complete
MMIEGALNTKGSRVKYLRNLTNLDRQDFCKQSGINFHTFKSWELDKMSGITTKGCQQFIAFIKTQGVFATIEWIMEGRGESPSLNNSQGSILSTTTLQELIILDNSMEPLVEEGGSVFYKTNPVSSSDLEIGRVYVVMFDKKLICRMFHKNGLFSSYKRSPEVKNAIISKELVSDVYLVSRIINS